jgi:succinate dehydrogenase/fumarate reductase flavoprotein subunit
MVNKKDLGKVYSSDILVIGGGIAGLVTAIKAKECNEDLDILVVDKGTVGWSGQGSKAGNGILASAKDQPIEKFAEFIIEDNGDYLNDQEFLLDYMSTNLSAVEQLAGWGVRISKEPDGSIRLFRQPSNLWSTAGIELFNCQSLRKHALKIGIRLLSRVQVFELLTKDGRVIGSIGFDLDQMKCHIFRAKAVAVATHGAHFKKMGGFFMAYGNGLGAAYRVGAHIRNAEFATEPDVVYSATFNPVYRGHMLVHNKDGVNISNIYAPNAAEVTFALILGMYKEVQEGRGPLYVDLSNPDPLRSLDDPLTNVNNQRFFSDKLDWTDFVKAKSKKFGRPVTDTPEVTAKFMLHAECMKVDREWKTNVEGLWAPGKISDKGSAYFGFVRGDGLGFALQSGLRAAVSMAKYATSVDFADLDVEQVITLKDRIYAPLNRKTTRKPSEIFAVIEDMAYHIDKVLARSDRSIRGVLAEVDEMYKIVPELTADDAHTLAKCHEAADCVLALEMIYRAGLMRTESRGGKYRHYREDYPERDDKNWMKWINIRQGKNGDMELFTEDIPMERYPYKPEGWVSSN